MGDYGAKNASSVSANGWGDHAYTLLAQFCPDIADAIHEEYEYVCSYTSNKVGGQEVQSTLPIRRSITAYVMRLYGLVLDDYNYGRLNVYLTLLHKVFIKKLVFFPENIVRVDYMRILYSESFNMEDFIHYVLIATQVRRVMEMQYVMDVFHRYQQEQWASG